MVCMNHVKKNRLERFNQMDSNLRNSESRDFDEEGNEEEHIIQGSNRMILEDEEAVIFSLWSNL